MRTGESAGILTFTTEPDFEMPASAAGSNEYIVIVNVQFEDKTNRTVRQTLTIRVADVNEAPTVGRIDSVVLIVGGTMSVGVATGFTDEDSGDTLTYAASSSNCHSNHRRRYSGC